MAAPRKHPDELGVRLREGPERGELVWRRPSRAGVQNMLRHPAYAGIYAYGRSRIDPRRRQAGRPYTGRVCTEREDWYVYLPGLLPAYISTAPPVGPRCIASTHSSQTCGPSSPSAPAEPNPSRRNRATESSDDDLRNC
jgi:hypothetical protein